MSSHPTHAYSSRGRTRQPKNLALPIHTDYANAKLAGSVTIVAANQLNETLVSSTAGQNGYDTQNQDYLHICMAQTGVSPLTVSIYAYNRCFGTWGRLKIPVSQATSLDAMYVNADIISVAGATVQFVIPIQGIDRVAFVAGTTTGLTLYAAGSTI